MKENIKNLLRNVNAHYRFFLFCMIYRHICQNFVLIRQLIRDLQTNGFNATSF